MKYLKHFLGVSLFSASIAAICGPSAQESRINGFEREIIKKATKLGCQLGTSTFRDAPGVHGIYLTACTNKYNDQRIVTAGWTRYPFGKNSPNKAQTVFEAFDASTFDPMSVSKDFSKEPKRRVVQPKKVTGSEIVVTPDIIQDRTPRFRCSASAALCDTSTPSLAAGKLFYSPGVQGAIASGLGAAASVFEGFTNGASAYRADFAKGVEAKVTLERVAAQMVQDAREVDEALHADESKWKELGSPQIEMLEIKESLEAKSIKQESESALKEADGILSGLIGNNTPSDGLADRSAVIGMLTEASLIETASSEIPLHAIRTAGADLGGFVGELRGRAFNGSDSPAAREIIREYRKWKAVRGHRREEVKARELLEMANRFAEGAAFSESEALLEEVRSLRYATMGYSPTKQVAIASESGAELKEVVAGNEPAVPFAQVVRSFERQQAEIAFKEHALQAKIYSQEPGEKLRYRDEAALSITSALRKIAGKQFYSGHRKASEGSQAMANGVVDLSLSLTPGVNVVKDFYELLSGRSVVTGEELTKIERSFAAIGVVTLGLTTEGKALAKLAGEVGDALKATKPVAEAFAKAEKLIEAANVFAPARKYLDRLYTAYREGKITAPTILDDIEHAIAEYPELYNRMKDIVGKELSFEYLRVIPTRYFDEAKQIYIDLKQTDVMNWHPGMISTNNRYTIGGSKGIEALYTMRLNKADQSINAVTKVALEEADLVGKSYHSAIATVEAKRVLDLTDEVVRSTLGINLERLIKDEDLVTKTNIYQVPQVLGDIAKELGFTHILAPSAKKPAFDSLIHLVRPN